MVLRNSIYCSHTTVGPSAPNRGRQNQYVQSPQAHSVEVMASPENKHAGGKQKSTSSNQVSKFFKVA